MKCSDFRKLIDGDVDDAKNREALDHLESCMGCASEVAATRQLKRSLTRMFEAETAPESLRAAVHDSVRAGGNLRMAPTGGVRRWVVPLGMAAAVAFVWLVAPLLFDRAPDSTAVVQARWVSSVAERHGGCTLRGAAHHRANLPRDAGSVRVTLGAELRLDVLVPDLVADGFRFHSADACGIGDARGAHIVYQRISDGRFLSIFTVPRMDGLRAEPGGGSLRRSYFRGVAARGAGVVAWHKNAATYVLCGISTTEQLIELAETIE